MATKETLTINQLKTWLTIILTSSSIIIGSLLWLINYIDDTCFPIESGENLSQEVDILAIDIKQVRKQNEEMILLLGRLEGKLESR